MMKRLGIPHDLQSLLWGTELINDPRRRTYERERSLHPQILGETSAKASRKIRKEQKRKVQNQRYNKSMSKREHKSLLLSV